MIILNAGFTDYPNDGLYHLATRVVVNIGNIASLSSLAPKLPPITTAAGNLESAVSLPHGAEREAAIATARPALIALLQNLVETINAMTGVPDADKAAVGFEVRQHATHSSAPPDAPKNLRVKVTGIPGELAILLAKVLRAVMYEVEYTLDPVNGPWTAVPAFNSTRGMKLTGLTRGKDYYVRVRAVAAGQNYGPWSDVAVGMVM